MLRSFIMVLGAVALVSGHSAIASQQDPLRFGMTVETCPAGLRVLSFEDGAPIAQRLQRRDVLVGFRVQGTLSRPTQIHTNDQLEAVKRLLAEDAVIDLTILRPTAADDGNPGYDQLVVVLRAADLQPRTVSYATSVEARTASADPLEKPATHTLVNVFYATDRTLVGDRYEGAMDLGPDPVKYGVCEVSVPMRRRAGEIPRPSWWPTEWFENPAKHMIIRGVSQLPGREALYEWIKTRSDQPDARRAALLFVHGYNVDFADAALRTAQLHYDLGFRGVSGFFSWPSKAKTSSYKADEEDIAVATPHIRDFVAALESRPEIEEIVIIAHSMGNRGVTAALAELTDAGGGKKVRELILAAPDINATVFNEQIAPRLAKNLPRTTVYASSRDRALAVSQFIGGYPRAGEMRSDGQPVVTPRPNLDVCDATIVAEDFWGHSAYGDSRSVIDDLWELIVNGQPADTRRMLVPVDSARGRFYRLRSK